MTIAAGLFLGAFGIVGTWFVGKRFPGAWCTRAAYALMTLGGILFVVWVLAKVMALGLAAAAALAVGGLLGVAGLVRRELRLME